MDPDDPSDTPKRRPRSRRVRYIHVTGASGVGIPELVRIEGLNWTPSPTCSIPWRENSMGQGRMAENGRHLFDDLTGESFDPLEFLARLKGCRPHAAKALYASLSGISGATGRKIGHGQSYPALKGFCANRLKTADWIHLSEDWSHWSSLSDKTRQRCIDQLRNDCEAGVLPFVVIVVSHTFIEPSPRRGGEERTITRWEVLIGNLASPNLERRFHWKQPDGRQRHVRLHARSENLSPSAFKAHLSRLSNPHVNRPSAPPSAQNKPFAQPTRSHGHSGDYRGSCFIKQPAVINPFRARRAAQSAGYKPLASPRKPTAGQNRAIRLLMRRCAAMHWDNCKISISQPHLYGFSRFAILGRFEIEQAVSAYESALSRSHMVATDVGTVFIPSGVVAKAQIILSLQKPKYQPPPKSLAARLSTSPPMSSEELTDAIRRSLDGSGQ